MRLFDADLVSESYSTLGSIVPIGFIIFLFGCMIMTILLRLAAIQV